MAKHKVITISVPALKKLIIFILLVGVLATTAFVTQKYYEERQQNQRAQEDIQRLSNPTEAAKRLEEQTIEQVNKLAVVPTEEKPVIQQIENADLVKDSGVVGDDVEDGDLLLRYFESGHVVLYRPSINKIVLAIVISEEDVVNEEGTSNPGLSDTGSNGSANSDESAE